MRLKDLGNLEILKNIFNTEGSTNAANFFNSLDKSVQSLILSSGQLTDSQLSIIKNNTVWNTSTDGIKTTISGLTEAEFDAALATTATSAAQKEAAGSTRIALFRLCLLTRR